MKKYSIPVSIVTAILLITGVYTAAWLPVRSAEMQFWLEESGDPSAMDPFSITGVLGDDYEQTDFTIKQGKIGQETSVIPTAWKADEWPMSFSAQPVFRVDGIREESFYAIRDSKYPESGYYDVTHTVTSTQMRLTWKLNGFDSVNGESQHFLAQIDTGLINRNPYRFQHSTYQCFETEPTQEEMERSCQHENQANWNPAPENPPTQSLIGYQFPSGMENVAQIGNVFYFVPTVKQEWEGTRWIYCLNRPENWINAAFCEDYETIGDITPLCEVVSGNMVDILGLYALENGTLVLCIQNQRGIAFQFYDSRSGDFLGEADTELFGVPDGYFFFYPDGDSFCAGFRSREYSQSRIVAVSTQNGGSILHPARTVNFRILHARFADGKLGIIGSKESPDHPPEYQIFVCQSGQTEPLYQAILHTPASQEGAQDSTDLYTVSRTMRKFTLERAEEP
ncbi:MAG: hypothetical protein ACOX6P_05955 [Candidatus Merdivicinus sp.]|jgi:hypothetical protein